MLSLCIIAKNEERFLSGCLESIRDVADEIILVDTGSTDRTPEIAQSFGCYVIHHQWQDDFAAARNLAIEAATGEWIFCIDADERLCRPADIKDLIARTPQSIGGYVIERHDMVKAQESGKTEVNPVGIIRLFRNDPRIRYQGAIHERPGESILAAGFQVGVATQLKLTHLVSALSEDVLRNKQLRYLTLLDRELAKSPDDPWFLYYRAKTRFYLKDCAGALRDFTAVGRSPLAYAFLRASACSMRAMVLGETGHLDEALAAVQMSLQIVPQQSLAHYVAAEILYLQEEYVKAAEEYSLVHLSLNENVSEDALHGDLYITVEKRAYKLGCCHLALGRIREAYRYFREGLGAHSQSADCYYGVALALTHMDDSATALQCLEAATRLDPGWVEPLCLTETIKRSLKKNTLINSMSHLRSPS